MIYTVFFSDEKEMPQDFETYEEANEYGEATGKEYAINSNNGNVV